MMTNFPFSPLFCLLYSISTSTPLTGPKESRTIQSKDPGPEGPALIIPRGNLVYRHSAIYGILEYWSDGVMEETPFLIALRKQIPGENLKVLSSFSFFKPTLQYSITPVDLYG